MTSRDDHSVLMPWGAHFGDWRRAGCEIRHGDRTAGLFVLALAARGMTDCRAHRVYQTLSAADRDMIVRWSSRRCVLSIADGCLGLVLIRLNSFAAAIIATMPVALSAICIASPFETSSSTKWLANASRTPRQ